MLLLSIAQRRDETARFPTQRVPPGSVQSSASAMTVELIGAEDGGKEALRERRWALGRPSFVAQPSGLCSGDISPPTHHSRVRRRARPRLSTRIVPPINHTTCLPRKFPRSEGVPGSRHSLLTDSSSLALRVCYLPRTLAPRYPLQWLPLPRWGSLYVVWGRGEWTGARETATTPPHPASGGDEALSGSD